jgi:phosphate/sulfate permease
MPELYLIIVFLLFLLAITDLIVGVSNDAVNFLNSSIGSKVASRKVIMIVASLGILAGATFSSGMMEVARKGIFNPEYFYFSEIMIIFIAVMLTDIILLDLFNTFGMPTSTTVSIVFELLGAAVAVAALKLIHAGDSLGLIGEYINSSSAILIISGIFISVLIAFAVGSMVQFFSRFLFTFHVHKRIRWIGGIWSGLALAGLTYFLVIKGLKGASFISAEFISWVGSNTWIILGISIVFWSLVMHICLTVFRINILRIVVLFGTFALAMAFAGNDLVNFIGVPIAGLESFIAWKASGLPADGLEMSSLNEPIRTQTYLLVIAGAIMVLTLWFSKKARSVTETEVNLGRQDEGSERFKSNALSRSIVRSTLSIGSELNKVIPKSWQQKIDKSFQPNGALPEDDDDDPPAFDLVRASVNLTVASALIAFATSLKLPLSTTYVSFMVAMGTSLADKAWGRSSAAFRVAGVINVIGGWFFTALMAFAASATFATLIYFWGGYGLSLLVVLVVFLVSRTFILHRNKEKEKEKSQAFRKQMDQLSEEDIIYKTIDKVVVSLNIIRKAYSETLTGLLSEDRALLQKSRKDIRTLRKENELQNKQLYGLIKQIPDHHLEIGRVYVLIFDLEQDILQSISLIVDTCNAYVDNSLDPIRNEHEASIRSLLNTVEDYLSNLTEMIQHSKFEILPKSLQQKQAVLAQLEEKLALQIEGIKLNQYGLRESMLIFRVILESKDLVAVAARFAKLYQRYYSTDKKQKYLIYQMSKEEF